MNDVAAVYTNTDFAEGNARTIDVDDINRVTGYEPDVVKYDDGTNNINQWKNEVTYTKKSGIIYYKGSKIPISESSSTYNSFTYFTEGGWKSLASGESTTLTPNYYAYYPQTLSVDDSKKDETKVNGSSQAYNLLFANTSGSDDKYYWLGSKVIATFYGYANFGVFRIYEGYVCSNTLYYSHRW